MLISICDDNTALDKIVEADYWPTEYSSSGRDIYLKAKDILLSIYKPTSYVLTIDFKNIKNDTNINCSRTNYPIYTLNYHLSINDKNSYDGIIVIDSDLDLVSINNNKQNTISYPSITTTVTAIKPNYYDYTECHDEANSTFIGHNQDQSFPAPDCEEDTCRLIELSPNSFDIESGNIEIKDPELQIGVVSEEDGSLIIDSIKQSKRDQFLKNIKINRKSKGE